jgi:hypothetical protein
MALTADANYPFRGPEPSRNQFGYAPSASAVIYRGALLAMTAAGTLQPIQMSGGVVFAGLADRASNTPQQPVVVAFVVGRKGTIGIAVPTVTQANIGTYLNAPVYATDDGTVTLTQASNLQIGTLIGMDNGLTYINILGS